MNWPEEFTLWYEKNKPPIRGGGLNDWLLRAARKLRHEIDDQELVKEIVAPIVEAQGGARAGEIERQVSTAFDTLPSTPGPKWHRNDRVMQTRVLEQGFPISLQN